MTKAKSNNQNEETLMLLEGIFNNEDRKFTLFYRKFFPPVRNFVVENKGTEEDAKDVIMNVLEGIFKRTSRNKMSLRDVGDLNLFFLQSCRYSWLNEIRKKKIFSPYTTEDCADTEDFFTSLNSRVKTELFNKYLEKMEPSLKKVLDLFLEGKSINEIALATGSTKYYAQKKKQLARNKLLTAIQNDPVYKELKNKSTYILFLSICLLWLKIATPGYLFKAFHLNKKDNPVNKANTEEIVK